MNPVSQKLGWVASKRKHPNADPAPPKLTAKAKLRSTIQVDACSLKLISKLMTQVFSFTWSKLTIMESPTSQVFSFAWRKLTMMESHRTSSPQEYGEDYYKENFPPHSCGEDHPKETFSNLKSFCH